jgi:hypothetical protein
MPTTVASSPFLAYADHSRLMGFSGRLVCTLEPLSPLHTRGCEPSAFYRDLPRMPPTILGTSLRGTVRTVLEIVANGCYLALGDTAALPRAVIGPCRQCWACAIFGYVTRQATRMGRVSFGDAVLRGTSPFPMERKSSRHLNNLEVPPYRGMPTAAGTPLTQGALFDFTVTFTNLAHEELVLLLYCLELEPGVRHKVGLAKADGFGTVEIRVGSMQLMDATTSTHLLAIYRAVGGPWQPVAHGPWLAQTGIYYAGGTKDHVRLQKLRELLVYVP